MNKSQDNLQKPAKNKKVKKPSAIPQHIQSLAFYVLGYSWVIATIIILLKYQTISLFMLTVFYLLGLSCCLYGNILWVKSRLQKSPHLQSFDYAGLKKGKRDAWIHLSALLSYVIPFANLWMPTWLWFRHQNPLEISSGIYVFNFQILTGLFLMTGCMLSVFYIGYLMIPVIWLLHILLTLIMAAKAAFGRHDKYPMDVDILRVKLNP